MSDEPTTPLVEIPTGLFDASHRGDIARLIVRPDTDDADAVAHRLAEEGR
jgi:hypothetical protein